MNAAAAISALFLGLALHLPVGAAEALPVKPGPDSQPPMDTAVAKDWLARWDKSITGDARNRYCDKETGEEIGWMISPFLDGFYYGYLATGDAKWIDLLVDWGDSLIKRGVKEPDGEMGWPKLGASG